MKNLLSLTITFSILILLFVGCTQSEKVKSDSAVDNTEISKQAVEIAF